MTEFIDSIRSAPDLKEIHAAMIARMDVLRPLVAECERLEKAEAALEKASQAGLKAPPIGTHAMEKAPYGYKADGTPYKRRPNR